MTLLQDLDPRPLGRGENVVPELAGLAVASEPHEQDAALNPPFDIRVGVPGLQEPIGEFGLGEVDSERVPLDLCHAEMIA